jgi:hypothetical protein
MKFILSCVLFVLIGTTFYAQNTIWGTVLKGGQYNCGYIYRTDSTGDNLVIVHHFNETVDGKAPGPIIQASNGKLYGMTSLGGQGVVPIPGPNSTTISTQGGTLFEYDPVTDNFITLHHFNSTDPQYPAGFYAPSGMKILEASSGKLWCVFNVLKPFGAVSSPAPRYILSYAVATNSMTPVGMLPSWTTTVAPGSTFNTSYTGELYKAANGFIYGTTGGYSSCATTSDPSWGSMGSVIRVHPVTYAFLYIRPFSCSSASGWLPESNLAETGSKLYGSTRWGGPNVTASSNGDGVIFEFDPATNIYTKKYDFPGGAMGGYPNGYIVTGANGKLYGTTLKGPPYQNFPNGSGILYEYDVTANMYTKKKDFIDGGTMAIGRNGAVWLKAHSGKLYGTTMNGIFEYDVLTDQLRAAGRFSNQLDSPNPLIEICRKPAYKASATNSYTICSNSFFTYDLHCDNAATFVWKQNGTAVPSQTTSLLSLNQIALSDAGTWVCEMTNDCGTTISPALTLLVNPAGTGVVTSTLSPAATTSICPNSTITLSGNNGGTWNTGESTASINTSTPGSYQVINTNACGNTFSNIIVIDTIPTPFPSPITFTTSGSSSGPLLGIYICPGDSALLTGNTNGVWNTGETTPSVYVKDLLPRYVITTNQCTTVTSATAQASYPLLPAAAVITQTGPIQICQGDSALLTATTGTVSLPVSWYKIVGGTYTYAGFGNSLYAKHTGNYYAKIGSACGDIYSQPIYINADTLALDTAIISASGALTFCPGGSVTLTGNNSNCTWNTGATSQSITVSQTGTYYVTNSNSCSSVVSAAVNVSVSATPVVSYVEPQVPVCLTTPAFTLAPASPPGGSYTGAGVTGNVFDPAIAGSGTHTVSYSFFDTATGCSVAATQSVYVDYDPSIVLAGPSTTVCEGSTVILVQPSSNGIWNTGQTGLYISVTAAGNYYVTQTNTCGNTVNSNTIQITINPLPSQPIITQTGNNLQASAATTYQWYLNGSIIPGATFQNYTPTQNGDYTVLISDPTGCYNTSAIYPFLTTGVQTANPGNNEIRIFPNPTTGNVTIIFPGEDCKVVITNSIGQVIHQKWASGEPEFNFKLTQTGVYVIEVSSPKATFVKKLVVYDN